ncbi:Nif11-like leader peptide family natural product precursor [Synechococcus sp. ATX 2A4]|uniref:Nif11-like leader peptide family natural product precursor n=1 Tax=Synechococcus sp. ATX 2A4 TaxID=2823727 RepID=UPI0028F40B44|nr:Nif11-like leader peptide family natural product precursor [Synechococcus sp. ATX 2A4]
MPSKIMSKAQLTAFLLQVEGDPALKARVDGAADSAAVVLIAAETGHVFSAATLSRQQRG